MNSEKIYNDIMYWNLECLWDHDHHSSKDFSLYDWLLSTWQNFLIQELLDSSKINHYNIDDVVQAYYNKWEYIKIIKILSQNPQFRVDLDFQNLIDKIIHIGWENVIIELASYIYKDSYKYNHFLYLINNLISNNNILIIQKITQTLCNKNEHKFIPELIKLYNTEKIQETDLDIILSSIFNEWGDEKINTEIINNQLDSVIQILDYKNNIQLYEYYLCYYKKHCNTRIFNKKTNEIESNLFNYYLEKWNFDKADILVKNYDSLLISSYQNKIIHSKIDYAIKNRDNFLHQEAINQYRELINQKISKIESITSTDKRELWQIRVEKCKLIASLNCELAIFEITNWDKEIAEKYIEQMIIHTESITKDIPEWCSKRNRWHIKWRIKIPFKKSIKERFLKLWLFSYLPKTEWWNNIIKTPEKRKEEKINKKSLKSKNWNSTWNWENSLDTELKNWTDINTIIKALRNYSYRDMSQDICEYAMLILDYYPEKFGELYNFLFNGAFISYYYDDDYNKIDHDYIWLAQFFIKWIQLWVVNKKILDSLILSITNIWENFSNDYKYRKFIVYIIKSLCNIWKKDIAYEIFNGISKFVDKTTKTIIIWYLTKSYTFENHDSITFKAFNDEIIFDSITKKDEIQYHNIQADIYSKLWQEQKYLESKEKINKLLTDWENPVELVNIWCKKMVNNCLRRKEDIENELNTIFNSKIWKIPKIRRRIIYTLIELWIPWIEKFECCKNSKTQDRIKLLYFKKLIQKKLINEKTKYLLWKNRKKNIKHIHKLFLEYNSKFNNIIESIIKINSDDIRLHNSIIKDIPNFKPTSWNKLFKILKSLKDIDINIDYVLYYHDFISKHKKWPQFAYYIICLIHNLKFESEKYPINKNNILDYLDDNDILIEFEKDKWIKWEWTIPWSKKWFLEDISRLEYLNPNTLKTFYKFWSIIWVWITEWWKNIKKLKWFYEYIFSNINLSNNRTSILQLWEVFNIIFKENRFDIFNEICNNWEKIWEFFKNFIEKYNISNKWRTIITLLFAREIRDSFSIFKNSEWHEQVDYDKLEQMIWNVVKKLKIYLPIIEKYSLYPINTSIWMEYEVTGSISKWYKENIWSDYKNDIETISEYAWVSKWNDAVHEIATAPTDNPMLLILEMKLLQDLDFIDLNFKLEDYNKWSRWLHITVWWEVSLKPDNHTNFIQNILIASNLWWLNAWKKISWVWKHWNIKQKKWYDHENIFWKRENSCVEYKSLAIDKKEQFERLVVSIFNLNMAKQAIEKYINFSSNILTDLSESTTNEEFKKILEKSWWIKEKIDETNLWIILEFLKLIISITNIINNHNINFENNESEKIINWEWLSSLILILKSTSPLIEIISELGIWIEYFKKLFEKELANNITINNIDDFENILKNDWIIIKQLTQRQKNILYKWFKHRIKIQLELLRKNNFQIYCNLWKYLNWNTDETIRKITNKKRFIEVISSENVQYEEYIKNLQIDYKWFYKEITPELVNIFTSINNLFIKRDSVNALSMYDSTKEDSWETLTDRRLSETTSFDKAEIWLKQRNWYYNIQWASEQMIIQAIQRKILLFNKNIEELIKDK